MPLYQFYTFSMAFIFESEPARMLGEGLSKSFRQRCGIHQFSLCRFSQYRPSCKLRLVKNVRLVWVTYMGITRSPLPRNTGDLPLPFIGSHYPPPPPDNIY